MEKPGDAARVANDKVRDIMKLKPYDEGEVQAVLRDMYFSQGKFAESLKWAKEATLSYKDNGTMKPNFGSKQHALV